MLCPKCAGEVSLVEHLSRCRVYLMGADCMCLEDKRVCYCEGVA